MLGCVCTSRAMRAGSRSGRRSRREEGNMFRTLEPRTSRQHQLHNRQGRAYVKSIVAVHRRSHPQIPASVDYLPLRVRWWNSTEPPPTGPEGRLPTSKIKSASATPTLAKGAGNDAQGCCAVSIDIKMRFTSEAQLRS